jgi:hypothetical protein
LTSLQSVAGYFSTIVEISGLAIVGVFPTSDDRCSVVDCFDFVVVVIDQLAAAAKIAIILR